MGLDMYIKTVEIKPVENDICYWRANRELLDFIDRNIHSYGDVEYAKDVELQPEDLKKIINFLSKQNPSDSQLPALKSALYDAENYGLRIVFCADW